MGNFTRVSGVTRVGRPVYQNANKQYLVYWAEYTIWMIGPDYTKYTPGVVSTSSSNTLDAYLVPAGNWYEAKDGSWQANSAITVVCTSAGMHLAAVHNTLCEFQTLVEKHAQHICGPVAGEFLAGWSP